MMLAPLLKPFRKNQADGSYSTFYLYCRLFRYIRPYLPRFVISALITLPLGALDGAMAYALKPFLDILNTKTAMTSLSLIPVVIIGLSVTQGVLNYFSIYLNGWLTFNIINDIRRDLFRKMHTMDIRYFDRITSGEIIQRYFRDPEQVQANILEGYKIILTRFFASITLIGVLIYNSWFLSILAVGMMLLILLPSSHIRKIIRKMVNALTTIHAELLSTYTESVGGMRVIYVYNLLSYRFKTFDGVQREALNQTMKKFKTEGWLTPSMHLIASCGIALVIWQGSRLVATGEMTTGALVSFLAALIMLYNPIKSLGTSLTRVQVSMLAAERIFQLIDEKPTITSKPEALSLSHVNEGIRFDDVTFAYANQDSPVLAHFNLFIPAGETVALVGSSGSGKTTITQLIPRFYDAQQGAIRIDGEDIRDLQLESLRGLISMVMQDNFLFTGSIRENLLLGNPEASEAELYDAVDKAYLREFIETLGGGSLSKGLDTQIGERGILLSGGQRQRVAIARALLKNAPIVILDEATSALDNQSESVVQQAIEALMENRTVIIIAHRLSTIRRADRIFVMERGRILEEGQHESLLTRDGVYTQLYNSQFKRSELEATL